MQPIRIMLTSQRLGTVVMDDETVYEITLDADTNSFSNLTGPYPDGNIRH